MKILDDDKNYCPFCDEWYYKEFDLDSHIETEHYQDINDLEQGE